MNINDGTLINVLNGNLTIHNNLTFQQMKKHGTNFYFLMSKIEFNSDIWQYDGTRNRFVKRYVYGDTSVNRTIESFALASHFYQEDDIIIGSEGKADDSSINEVYISVNKVEQLYYNDKVIHNDSVIAQTHFNRTITDYTETNSSWTQNSSIFSTSGLEYTNIAYKLIHGQQISELCIGSEPIYYTAIVTDDRSNIYNTAINTVTGSHFENSGYRLSRFEGGHGLPGWLDIHNTTGDINISNEAPILRQTTDYRFYINLTFGSDKHDIKQHAVLNVIACYVDNCDECYRTNPYVCKQCSNDFRLKGPDCAYD